MVIFGNRAYRPAQWLRAALSQARRVGRITVKPGIRSSGFLLDGELFDRRLERVPLLITCNHAFGSGDAVEDANVVFEGMFDDPSQSVASRFSRKLVGSPVGNLDYSLLLMERWPGQVPRLIVAPRPPIPGDRVYAISYPLGAGLAVALEDNEVVEPKGSAIGVLGSREHAVYYRAATLPGSSGGLVFNELWEAVAIHVGHTVAQGAVVAANYGMRLDAVLDDAKHQLEGIEIPDEELEAARKSRDVPSSDRSEANYFSVFISYSHDDSAFANRLCNALQASGVRAWLDEKQMLPGDDIYEEVQRGIRNWDKVLLCCSRASLTSWWVDSEIDRAFQKERDLFKLRQQKVLALVPLDLDGFLFEGWSSAKAQEVKSRLAGDFRGWIEQEKFEAAFHRLLLALRADETARERPPESKI